jgi:hypothetical protein
MALNLGTHQVSVGNNMKITKTAWGDWKAEYKGIIAYAKTIDLAILQLTLKLA